MFPDAIEGMLCYWVKRLNGNDRDGRFQGDLVFFDAYPSQWPKLCVDVINCHHPQYYRDIERESEPGNEIKPFPSETESPVPVFFLAVDEGTSFIFRIGSRSENLDNLEQGLLLIEQGLGLFGFGAKTAVSYGVMHKVDDSTRGSTATPEHA